MTSNAMTSNAMTSFGESPQNPARKQQALIEALQDPARKKQALIEINQELLSSFYAFKSGSSLKAYFQNKIPEFKHCYTLHKILSFLKNIIQDEQLFDAQNPAIILCSEDLENAFNKKTIHVSEIRGLVSDQLLRLPERFQIMLKEQEMKEQQI